jgi:coenzyme Q-binding protein COQ10
VLGCDFSGFYPRAGLGDHVEEYTLTRAFPQDQSSLFKLVSGIEHYPEFVPGYQSVSVRKRSGRDLRVTQTVRILGWEMTFESIATLSAPQSLVIDAFPPGFRAMRIKWSLDTLPEGGTRVGINIRYETKGLLMSMLSRPWVRTYAEMQVRAFLERANRLYGGGKSGP